MNKAILAAAVLTIISSAAMASDDLLACQHEADMRIEEERRDRQTADAINLGAGLLGSLAGGGSNVGNAAASAIRMQGHRVSMNASMDASRKRQYISECMRGKNK